MRRWLLVVALLLVACGEPPVDVAIPPREGEGRVADLAGILDVAAVEDALDDASAATALDTVALTYTTEQASCGEAFRAGGALLAAWDADVALVAVARPGDFEATGADRERCVGIRPADDFAVPSGLREEIAERLVPPLAADNRWTDAFVVAAERLAEEAP